MVERNHDAKTYLYRCVYGGQHHPAYLHDWAQSEAEHHLQVVIETIYPCKNKRYPDERWFTVMHTHRHQCVPFHPMQISISSSIFPR